MKKTLLIIGVVASGMLAGCGEQEKNAMTAFADCLTEKGAKMYGTEWCGHCKNQKKLFGNSFSNVDYTDCDKDKESCLKAGVEGYPTWVFSDGSKNPGTQELSKLAEKTNCELPADAAV